MNCDVTMQHGALRAMLAVFKSHPATGMVRACCHDLECTALESLRKTKHDMHGHGFRNAVHRLSYQHLLPPLIARAQVVPKFLQPSGAILDSGGLVFSDGSGWQYGRDEPPNKAAYNYIRPTDYGSSYCTMVQKRANELKLLWREYP